MSFRPTANHAVTFFNIHNLKLTVQKNHLFTYTLLEQIYFELTQCRCLLLGKVRY